jgi:hypothetical protein
MRLAGNTLQNLLAYNYLAVTLQYDVNKSKGCISDMYGVIVPGKLIKIVQKRRNA